MIIIKKLSSRKQAEQLSYFEEDKYAPSRINSLLLLPTDPFWYCPLILMTFLQSVFIFYQTTMPINHYSENQTNYRFFVICVDVLYFFDVVFCFVAQHILKLKIPVINYVKRPIWIMLMELLSVIPFELLTPPTRAEEKHLYYFIRITHTLKCYRILYHIRRNNHRYGMLNALVFLELVFNIILYEMFITTMYNAVYCSKMTCKPNVYCAMYEEMSNKVIGKGVILNADMFISSVWLYELPIVISNAILIMLIIFPTMCKMFVNYLILYQHKFKYVNKHKMFNNNVLVRRLKNSTKKRVTQYFIAFWNKKGGYHKEMEHKFAEINPYTLNIDIAMDYSSKLFLHCPIFSQITIEPLRIIAPMIKRVLLIPGDYVCKKNTLKESQIYIVNGIVDIPSNENGESPVITFTSGTCIGTTSLIAPYNSEVDYRCRTIVELYVLERNDFIALSRNNSNIYQFVFSQVMDRYKHVMQIHKKKLKSKRNLNEENLVDVKRHLHNMLSKNNELAREYQHPNIYLHYEIEHRTLNRNIAIEYLDTIVLKERTLYHVDSVFIKSTFLWILRPNSPVLNLWENIIIVLGTYAGLLVPYCCCIHYSSVSWFILKFLALTFIMDVLIQSITSIYSDNRKITILEIISAKIRYPTFVLDCLIIFPGFLFARFYSGDKAWYELNKAFKIYRLIIFFRKWSTRIDVNIVLHILVKYFVIYMVLTYYVSLLLILYGLHDSVMSPLSLQMVTGVGYIANITSTKAAELVFFTNNCALLLHIMMTLHIVGAMSLSTHQTITRLYQFFDNYKISNQILPRVKSYLNTQTQDNDKYSSVDNSVYRFPSHLMIMINSEIYIERLKNVQLFQNIPLPLIKTLSGSMKTITFQSVGILISRGIIRDTVYILLSGAAVLITGPTINLIKEGMVMNLLEACYGTPSIGTVIALTEIRVLSFQFSHFLNLLKEYPVECQHFINAIKECRYIKPELVKILKGKEATYVAKAGVYTNSFYVFKKIVKESYEEYDYYIPYDKIYPFNFIRKFLMSRTINPDGKFLKWTEFIRCFFAIISTIIYSIVPFTVYPANSGYFWGLFLLDLTIVPDMYLRFHVCYYTKDGVLVKHPWSTAKHYFTHSFITDLISVFPFYCVTDRSSRALFNLTRSIQMYRVIAYKRNTIVCKPTTYVLYFTLLYVILMCYLSAILYVFNCQPLTPGVCEPRDKPDVASYMILFYLVTSVSTATGIGLHDDYFKSKSYLMQLSVVTMVGFFLKYYILALIFVNIHRANREHLIFRRQLTLLYKYMKKQKVKKKLVRKVMSYFDLHWNFIEEYNVNILLENVTETLKNDLIFDLHVSNLVLHSNLTAPSNQHLIAFYKNITLSLQPQVLLANNYLLKVNDVHGYIYFLHSGSVQVTAADGTELTKLHKGSMFGNLKHMQLYREKVNIISITPIEIFRMPTIDFYNKINVFPEILSSFRTQKYENTYYIRNKAIKILPVKIISKCKKRFLRYLSIACPFHAILICYFGVLLEIYQFATIENNGLYRTTQHILDVLHFIYIFIYFITFKYNFKKNKIDPKEFCMMLVTSVPLDLLIEELRISDVTTHMLVFTLLRLNRWFRLYYYVRYYHMYITPPSICRKIYIRIGYIVSIVILHLFITAAILMVMDRLFADSPSYTIINHKEIYYEPFLVKLEAYMIYIYKAALFTKAHNDRSYYPTNDLVMTLMIFIMIYNMVFYVIIFVCMFVVIMESSILYVAMFDVIRYYNYYISTGHVSDLIKKKINFNLDHKWRINKYRDIGLLNNRYVPRSLSQEVKGSIYGILLTNHPFFCNTHIDFRRQILNYLRKVSFSYNEIIIRKYDIKQSIYIINNGTVNVLVRERDLEALEKLHRGDSFGVIQGIYPNICHEFTYKADSECEILELKYHDWKHLLKFFPAAEDFIYCVAQTYIGKSSCRTIAKDIEKKKN